MDPPHATRRPPRARATRRRASAPRGAWSSNGTAPHTGGCRTRPDASRSRSLRTARRRRPASRPGARGLRSPYADGTRRSGRELQRHQLGLGPRRWVEGPLLVKSQAQRLHLAEENRAPVAADGADAIHVRLVVVRRAQVPGHVAGQAHRAREGRRNEAVLVVGAERGSLVVLGHALIIPGPARA